MTLKTKKLRLGPISLHTNFQPNPCMHARFTAKRPSKTSQNDVTLDPFPDNILEAIFYLKTVLKPALSCR